MRKRHASAVRDVVETMITQDREKFLREEIKSRDAEIERLKIEYGVVACPERTFRGPCGHLWDYGPTRKTCPHCAEVERLTETIQARDRQIETVGGLLRAAQATIEELKSRPPDPVFERARKAEAEVERLLRVVAAQDELLGYRAECIRKET